MEKKTVSNFLLALAAFILVIMMAYMAFPINPPVENEELPEFINYEEPIEKNANLTLEAGDVYIYQYYGENKTDNISFVVQSGSGCKRVHTPDLERSLGTCIYRDGTDYTGSNVTLADPYVFMFKPWMLAVHENWEWNVSVYAVMRNSSRYVFDIGYRTIRTDIIDGRRAYVVEIDTGGGLTIYDWIDKEKRILLKEESIGTEIVLVKGIE